MCLLGKGLTSNLILKLDNALDELMLPYSFDLSIFEKIDNQNFKDHISRVGMVLYQK
ncbi:MAG: hypothetical protein KDD34_09535 [Bdellovibrionales bacterium]|nr:hypothetical protein [Bdellovibrionales bacterium]